MRAIPSRSVLTGILALFLATLAASADARGEKPSAAPSPRLEGLIAAERAFSNTSAEKGIRPAFLQWLADDAVIFRPRPVNGKAWYLGRPASPARLTWEPTHVELSGDGRLGLSTGPWEVRRGDDPAGDAIAFGHFVSMWKMQPDGAWRVVMDVGVSYERADRKAEALTTWEGALRPGSMSGAGSGRAWGTPNGASVDALIAEDQAYVADAARSGLAAASKTRLAEDARVYRDGEFPWIGRAAALKRLALPAGRTSWRPLGGDCAASGDLGYTYGLLAFTPDAVAGKPAAPPDSSLYMRVWRRDAPQARWQLVLDITSPIPPPPATPETGGSGPTGAPAPPVDPAGTMPPLSMTPAASTALLPPTLPWNGKSARLTARPDDPWLTPCERSGFATTPRYDETIAWLKRLDEATPLATMISLGKSPEGRDIWMVVVSADGAATPDALKRNGKPTLLAQAGIHAGEIDGKDAGMMFLRDLTVGGSKRGLLDRANFLFVPIFNVDGHERFSPFGRVNQRGPTECGWRTNARNLNLNRDYAKTDTPEMMAMVRALDAWDPDLYYDIHVTDGIDYQYDITYGFNGEQGYSPNTSRWLERTLRPAVDRDLTAMGHVPGRLIFNVDDDLSLGLVDFMSGPRFSNSYGNVRHLPTILVENHSLKPYRQRVLGTRVLLESTLQLLGQRGAELRAATAADRARRPAEVPLSWKTGPGDTTQVDFLGVASRRTHSNLTGGMRTEWLGKPLLLKLPFYRQTAVDQAVTRPKAYWIPPQWREVIERLKNHGIRMETIDAPRTVDVEMYRLEDVKLGGRAFEGHVGMTARPVAEPRTQAFPAGSVRISTDQPLGDLAVVLLEPLSGDSFFQWGFFPEVLQETEYVEGYVMEPMAEAMMAAEPALRTEFEAKVAADSAFAADPGARLRFFYRRTPYRDDAWRLYPVAREVR